MFKIIIRMKTTAIITMSFLTVFFLGCKDDRAINLYPMEPVSGYEIIYKPNEINIVESINDKHDTLKMYKHNKEYYLKENNRNRLCMSVLRDSGDFIKVSFGKETYMLFMIGFTKYVLSRNIQIA